MKRAETPQVVSALLRLCRSALLESSENAMQLFCELADERRLFLAVRLAIGAENFVKPDRRLTIGVGMFPGVPRQIGLRFPRHQSPVDCANIFALQNWQISLKRAAVPASHIFRANQRPVIGLQPLYPALEFVRLLVAVKRDHIRILDLN